MALPLKPILSALRHHRLTTFLLILQVALTCAIVINACFLLIGRIERITMPSGLPEDQLSLISVRGLDESANALAQQRTDLAALRAINGVQAVAAVNDGSLPLSHSYNGTGACSSQAEFDRAMAARGADGIEGCVSMPMYGGSSALLSTLGLRLLAGRDFSDAERAAEKTGQAVIVTHAMGQRLWPGENPVGKRLYGFNGPIPVVGMIDDILTPVLSGGADDHVLMLVPNNSAKVSATYVLRSAPSDRQRVLREAAAALEKSGPVRLIPEDEQRPMRRSVTTTSNAIPP